MKQDPHLPNPDDFRVQLRLKMSEEVDRLEQRVLELDRSNRVHKDILIATYRKLIARKQSLLRQLF